MKIIKKNIIKFVFLFVIALTLHGCVVNIPIPEIGPLVEHHLEGRGTDKILIVDISGIINDTEDENGFMGLPSDINITARLREELDTAYNDKHIKAVIVRINTPGGTVTASDIIYNELKNFKEVTDIPVVAVMMDMATSGGYYVAAAAEKIYAHPTTVTGSIGVIAFNINATGLMKKIGLTDETIKSGDAKDVGSPVRKQTKKDKEILQGVIDSMFARFIGIVEESRKDALSEGALDEIKDGRIFTADRAFEIGLVDKIGYLGDAITDLKTRLGLKEAKVVSYKRPGAYAPNIYASVSAKSDNGLNIIGLNRSGMVAVPGVKFMYLWTP